MMTLNTKTKGPNGAFGTYFRVSRTRGIKLLRGSYRSIVAAYNSNTFDMAKGEAEILKVAEESDVVPKCFGVRIVKRGTRYRVGILMQDLGQVTLASQKLSGDQESDIYDQLNDALEHAGVQHNDLHSKNIMFYKGKYYAIDFSADISDINDCN